MINLKKGLIIEYDYVYILVQIAYHEGKIYLDCLDYHANNIHSLDLANLKDVEFIDPSKYSCEHEAMSVVGEVLAGQHDGRFNHWYEV